MKKLFKYILIAVTIFFIGIVNAKAEDVTNITCTYKLPYTGLDINSNTTLGGEPTSLYFTAQFVLTISSDGRKINVSRVNNYKDKIHDLYPKVELEEYLIQNNNECPKYLNLKKGAGRELGKIAAGLFSFPLSASITNRVMEPATEQEFIENLKNNSGNIDNSTVPTLGLHKFIVPLYSIKKEENGKTTEEFSSSTMQKYVDTTLDGWYTILEENKQYINTCSGSGSHSGGGGRGKNSSSSCNLYYQASRYLDAIGIDGNLRNLANKNKFDVLYKQVEQVGLVSEKLSSEIEKEKALDDTKTELANLNQNICNVYCVYSDDTSKEHCINENSDYKKCTNCYNSCTNVPSSELEKCLIGCMGESEYNNLINLADKYKNELQQEIEKTTSSLYKINVPTLSGISFKSYKVQCSDFSILHIFWQIVTISAPILTILFGILDYGKAVISSDEEKIRKSWKKFPKRLLALIILIIVPILISIVVSNFGTNDGVKDTSILKCVVNGE